LRFFNLKQTNTAIRRKNKQAPHQNGQEIKQTPHQTDGKIKRRTKTTKLQNKTKKLTLCENHLFILKQRKTRCIGVTLGQK
jgi:hypothetical protein